jgi:hypothetical protein
MKVLLKIINILAIELPSLRISPLLAFVLLGAGALLINVMYIQSIGSGLTSFGDLFIFSLVPIKPKRLTKSEREKISLTPDLIEILVGLLIVYLHSQKQEKSVNPRLIFQQGIIHKEYFDYLYELFKFYGTMMPKISISKPHPKTGNLYTTIRFSTLALPCFAELHNSFYPEDKKIVPVNIADLLTPRGLGFLICDDGSFDKPSGRISISTNCFSLDDVKLLVSVLTDKFDLKCTISRERSGHIIRITRKSLPAVQALLKDIMPPMMLYKIGL